MKYSSSKLIYGRLGWLLGVLSFFSIIIPAFLKADSNKVKNSLGEFAEKLLLYIQQNAWWMIPILLISVYIIDRYRKTIGNPKDWGIIQSLLNEFREKLFSDCLNDELHHHRITLYKYYQFYPCFRRWPWSGWLIPVARSGHTTQKSDSYFLAPDKAELVEGIAGQTWSRNAQLYVPSLPNLIANPTDINIRKYAEKTWISEQKVRARKYGARSYCGLPVELNGKLWGVIVIDSYNTKLREKVLTKSYNNVAKYLGKVLEGM